MSIYQIETASRPHLSMIAGSTRPTPSLDAFHKLIGRPESYLTFSTRPDSDGFGQDFSLHISKGQTVREALTRAAEDLAHPDTCFNTAEEETAARRHVPFLLSCLNPV